MENQFIWQVANVPDSNHETLLNMSDCHELCYFLEKFGWPKYDIVSHDNIDPDVPRNYPGIIFHELTQEMYDYWMNEEYDCAVQTDSKYIRSSNPHKEVNDSVIPLQTIWENASNIRN